MQADHTAVLPVLLWIRFGCELQKVQNDSGLYKTGVYFFLSSKPSLEVSSPGLVWHFHSMKLSGAQALQAHNSTVTMVVAMTSWTSMAASLFQAAGSKNSQRRRATKGIHQLFLKVSRNYHITTCLYPM